MFSIWRLDHVSCSFLERCYGLCRRIEHFIENNRMVTSLLAICFSLNRRFLSGATTIRRSVFLSITPSPFLDSWNVFRNFFVVFMPRILECRILLKRKIQDNDGKFISKEKCVFFSWGREKISWQCEGSSSCQARDWKCLKCHF